MAISDNLKDLRIAAKMTQEEAANKLGLTRQALSSYETGRTQPGIDMLKTIACVYETDIDSILYGNSQLDLVRKTSKIVSTTQYILIAVLTFISSACLFAANYFFPLNNADQANLMTILEYHQRLSKAWELLDTAIIAISWIGFIFLLYYFASKRFHFSTKYRLVWSISLIIIINVIALCFGTVDPVFSIANYISVPLSTSVKIIPDYS